MIFGTHSFYSTEDPDNEGRTLNLGETVILEEEINRFISILRKKGILVTALHNHWLFDEPRLIPGAFYKKELTY
ncbi:hypothetical protein UT300006_12830 [Clostridium sp. CTA-6]|uniref:DUF1259 domain-containing protein n=1 Tax=Clostridium botulinum B2 450 TaxID=1379739 RepID=A0A0D1AI75_CLOBO|nr:hypothetical protein CLOSPO_01585 [Clostridium sporogenes ATCC 15579]KIS22869.1 hypothetical protein N495_04485 [Clostridium botulinum B2 450]